MLRSRHAGARHVGPPPRRRLRDGSVTSATVTSDMGVPELDRCLEQVVLGLKFPAPRGGGVVKVTYPFVFRPDGD